MSQKIDRKALMRTSLSKEKKLVNERFATAEAILSERPLGLAVVPTPIQEDITFSAESDPLFSRHIFKVPLNLIHENPLNARFIYKPDVIKELAASIATRGQMVAATAVKHPTLQGEYVLLDGHYRKKAAAIAGCTTLDLVVRPKLSDLEMYRSSWLLNEERTAQSTLDNALAWRALLDKNIIKNEGEIAELLSISLSNVNKTLSILAIPSTVLDKMREHPQKFGVFIGYELSIAAKILSTSELDQLVDRIVSEDLSSRQVATIRTQLEVGHERKRKETSRQYKINRAGIYIGALKEWDSGKITLEVKLSDSKERALLISELVERFEIER